MTSDAKIYKLSYEVEALGVGTGHNHTFALYDPDKDSDGDSPTLFFRDALHFERPETLCLV